MDSLTGGVKFLAVRLSFQTAALLLAAAN